MLGTVVFILGGSVKGSHRGREENACRRPAVSVPGTSRPNSQSKHRACDHTAKLRETRAADLVQSQDKK